MKVPVIIPCYNVAGLVERSVRSALAQVPADTEVLAVDDGSTDSTLEVLRALERDAGGRMRVITQANAGASAARNAGLAATEGEWVQFLDADDALLPGKIARQVDIGSREKADVVLGAYVNDHPNGRAAEIVVPLDGDPWEALVRTRMGTTSANLFRREALLSVGAWDVSLRSSQDYELLFRMLKRGMRRVCDRETGCEVQKRVQGSISRTNERENWLRYLDLRLAMRDHLRTLDPRAHAATIAIADQHLFMAIRVLSKHDRAAAFEAYDRMLPHGIRPERNKATTAPYILIHRLFGFRFAERMAGLLSGPSAR